ncbi:hypothetical protein SELMODRAFT_420483 [Selaginella moellendorffii]|uniref:Mvd1 C-terminal domain-containing protein n=1 Tax=Selaginella moellendorffii TaxID=88036 RepID=D8SC48_SELML|nr:hypothetical protein SELMODRAFT_420483 [Selaginella moellendorffii]
MGKRQKEEGSTSGMQESVQTSPLLHYRAKVIFSLSIFDFLAYTDSNQFHATCLDTSPPFFYMSDTSRRIIGLVESWNKPEVLRVHFDAGPNAVIFFPQKFGGALLHRLLYKFPPIKAWFATMLLAQSFWRL